MQPLPQPLLAHAPTLDLQGGEDVEEDVMAQEVVNLIARTACRQCLVWAKSDLLIRLVKELDPLQAVGYVVLNETAAARAAGMHRLLRMPQAEVVALHFAMASAEVVQVGAGRAGGWVGGRRACVCVIRWVGGLAGDCFPVAGTAWGWQGRSGKHAGRQPSTQAGAQAAKQHDATLSALPTSPPHHPPHTHTPTSRPRLASSRPWPHSKPRLPASGCTVGP